MPRIPRSLIVFPGHSVHKIWRGHNREWNLGDPSDKRRYLEFLNDELEEPAADKVTLEALTLMSNHTHEMFGIEDQATFSNQMRRHHSRYGAYFNRKYERCGKVAQDRPRTCLIGDNHHALVTSFYIHANPLRAHIVRDAKDYFWSTYRLYAFGKRDAWMKNVVLPKWYLCLGSTMQLRQRKYRRLFAEYLRREGMVKRAFLLGHFFGSVEWYMPLEKRIVEWRETGRIPP